MLKIIPHISSVNTNLSYRTEDIRFSPSGRRLAVASTDNCLLIYAVDLTMRPIRIELEMELRSLSLLVPHGVEFLSEDKLVVANRNGNLSFFQISPLSDWHNWHRCLQIESIFEVQSPLFGLTDQKRMLRDRELFCGPGSVRFFNNTLYVSCNYLNTVSTFFCQLDNEKLSVQEGIVIAHHGLEVIDGIALSQDGNLMALSDHDNHRVVIYRRTMNPSELLGRPHFSIICSLTDIDMHYAHGLCFDRTGNALFVADAGGRYINVFKNNGDWDMDMLKSSVKIIGVDLEAFNKTQDSVNEKFRILEGGEKGLDIDPSGRIMVTTCNNQTIRFFEIYEKE